MRKLLLLLTSLFVFTLVAFSQQGKDIQNKVEVVLRKGTKNVTFKFAVEKGTNLFVNWGDGKFTSQTDTYGLPRATPRKGVVKTIRLKNKVSHTFDTPLSKDKKIIIEGKNLQGLEIEELSEKAFGGFGQVDAPKLQFLSFGFLEPAMSCISSFGGRVDLSKCLALKWVALENLESVSFAKEAPLYMVEIRAFSNKMNHEGRGSLQSLDLSSYSKIQYLELKNLDLKAIKLDQMKSLAYLIIDNCPIKEINLSSLSKLREIKIRNTEELKTATLEKLILPNNCKFLRELDLSNNLLKVLDLGSLTQATKIKDINLENNCLSYSSLLVPANVTLAKNGSYKYAQKECTLQSVSTKNFTIDLSKEMKFLVGGDEKKTQVSWFSFDIKTNKEMELPKEAYEENKGVFTFNEKIFNGKNKVHLFAKLKNEAFPKIYKLNGKELDTYPTSKVEFEKTGDAISSVEPEHVSFYPNPTKDFLYIHLKKSCLVSIYSLLGERIYQKQYSSGDYKIDFRKLEKGKYIVNLGHSQHLIVKE